jgi:hypothetical protein
MIGVHHKQKLGGIAAALVVLTAAAVPVLPVQAQTPHKRNFAQRHPTATGAAAGLGAYALAKKTGKARARNGRHRNFAQRHPVLTGVAAGMVAHHYAKKHRH